MKILAVVFFLSSLFVLGSCSDSDNNEVPGIDDETIDQTDITQKIAAYYSAPSSTTSAVAAIQAAFEKKFPNATDIEWKVSNNVYEIDFEIANVDYEAWYDGNATLLMYKFDIANSQVASAVSTAITTDYPGYAIDDAEMVYKGTIVGYYLDLKKNKNEVNAFYKEDGTFISKTLWENDTVKPGNDAETETPEITGSLTDEEVDAYLSAYYSSYDQDINQANVPAAIRTNFSATFPNAHDIDWELSSNVYKVDFDIYNVDYDAWYTENGTLIAYKFDITRSSVPSAITSTISTQFSGYSIDDAEKVVKANSVGYFIELESRNVEEDAYFAEDGTYISNSFYKTTGGSGSGGGSGTETPPVTPEIPESGEYTDDQIDALLQAFDQSRDVDVRESNVPAAVLTAFNSQFTSTYDREWEYASGVYKVEFEIGHTEYEAWYAEAGILLMYTQEVRYTTIPTVVQNAVSTKYSTYKVDGCDYFRKGTVIGYMIELENNRTGADLIALYNENGTFITERID